jgi:cephalosporin hydroxylase
MDSLSRWQCHKKVHAGKIVDVTHGNGTRITILDSKGNNKHVLLDMVIVARYTPKVGDYYVVYEDGYASISPKKAFEEGYSLIVERSKEEQEGRHWSDEHRG